MIDFGMIDVPAFGGSFKTTSLHIDSSYTNTDGTIYDKDLWDNTPHHRDNEAVNDWTQDVSALQPKSICDQWSAEEWNEWADKWDNIPACGKESSPEHHELEPLDLPADQQQQTADEQLALPTSSGDETGKNRKVKVARATPTHMVMCCHALLLAAVETMAEGGDVESFKQGALSNVGAATAVGKELLALHVFPESPTQSLYVF